jgi:ABC-2 type transport system permease protein
MSTSASLAMTGALMRRALNEVIRVPGAAVPGVIAPTLFLLGLVAVFGNLTEVRGFGSDDYLSFLAPVSLLQCAGFTGAATGVNLARDIEHGWFDRLLVSPAPRLVLLGGVVLSAALRALVPVTMLLVVAFALGLNFPGIDGMLLVAVLVPGFAIVAGCWGAAIALRFRTQAAGPLIQSVMFAFILFTSSYAPKELLAPWLEAVATINPVTWVIEGMRAGFVGSLGWAQVWPALLAELGLGCFFGSLALRALRRTGA